MKGLRHPEYQEHADAYQFSIEVLTDFWVDRIQREDISLILMAIALRYAIRPDAGQRTYDLMQRALHDARDNNREDKQDDIP